MQGTGTASVSYVFHGNSLLPTSVLTTGVPQPGDTWAAGVSQYAGFYDRYRVDGSSIKINIVNRTAGAFLKCVLLSAPITTTLSQLVTDLDALSYEDLMSWQYASWKNALFSGNNQSVWFNKFRKTKHMLSYKNASDNNEVESLLPNPNGSGGSYPVQSNTGYIYYLRLFNQNGATGTSPITYDLTIRMILYTTLLAPTLRTQVVVPTP